MVDNRYVLPYCSGLSRIFNCHINVEVVSSVRSVKYLYKYVYKGYYCRGVKSFDELKNVNGVQYMTFSETCLALGLIDDDEEWSRAMQEAVS